MQEPLTLHQLLPACDATVSAWVVWGVADEPCPTCGGCLVLLARDSSSDSLADLAVVCVSEGLVTPGRDLPLAAQNLLQDRLSRVKDLSSTASASSRFRMMLVLLTGPLMGGPSANVPIPAVALPDSRASSGSTNEETAIPSGFRSVSWIRDYEAEVIVTSYNSQRTEEFVNDKGSVVFRAVFHSPDTAEAIKYRASVEAVRVRSTGVKVIGWIRKEEAQAVIDANRIRQDVHFNHVTSGNGGLVQYFPPDSSPAMKYLSTTRLLRKSRA
jgi:hypothetical protein